ncbi:hypothetical protein E2C01_087051 [Portunus trituberculatus]|uniref:Uncharacterized protein n=1 Tax=Portunus trituberculatus TaxID=210409 RepID=A0A5B7JI15_PORTR|nr:hypothetical protein [Portunus trituberculatus]
MLTQLLTQVLFKTMNSKQKQHPGLLPRTLLHTVRSLATQNHETENIIVVSESRLQDAGFSSQEQGTTTTTTTTTTSSTATINTNTITLITICLHPSPSRLASSPQGTTSLFTISTPSLKLCIINSNTIT